MDKNTKMNKNILVSFLLVASLFVLATSIVSAWSIDDGDMEISDVVVKIDGMYADSNPAVIAGETVSVKVYFTADADASEVVIKAELGDNTAKTSKFDIEYNEDDDKSNRYSRSLTFEVPYDFDDDDLSDIIDLDITIEAEDENGDDVEAELETIELTVQRPSYNVEIKPIHVPSSVEAGDDLSIDVIVENNGYNDLDDLYLTASISELGVEETFYIGDLTDVEEDEDDSSVHKRITLEVPYDAEAGEYTLQVKVSNEDADVAKATIVVTENNLPNQVIKTDKGLIIVNPTDKVAAYTIVAESPATVSQSTVVVEDGSSVEVAVTANTSEEFDVSVFSATGELIDTITFSGTSQTSEVQLTNPVFVLTVILAVVFLVLLVVLVVLITKKPQKTEEFGESYY